MTVQFTDNVLPFWLSEHALGHRVCLVSLVGIDGSSPRPLGSQIVVSETGTSVGYITGGCAEAAIVAEALNVLQSAHPIMRRYGEGSPYKDIVLPCGSGIDVHFMPDADPALIQLLQARLNARGPTALSINLNQNKLTQVPYTNRRARRDNDVFYRPYVPLFRLLILGKGPIVPALAGLAAQSGFIVTAYSPEPETLAAIPQGLCETLPLTTPDDFTPPPQDAWTICALLFHDHDWEPVLLKQILDGSCFYIGALGSRNTHQQRIDTLKALDFSDALISNIKGPIGLDIQATTPYEIAISILAEIIQTYRQQDYGPSRWQR